MDDAKMPRANRGISIKEYDKSIEENEMMRKLYFVAMLGAFATSALAAVSADEAKKLGTTLTEWGAEKAGNKDGTIPAYDTATAQPKAPAGWDAKNPWNRPDPYSDKPLF